MVTAWSPSLPCLGNWPGTWTVLKLKVSSEVMRVPYAALANLSTSPLCYAGAERVTHLSLLNLVSSKACTRELFFFINCQPVPSLTAEGAPWDGYVDGEAASARMLWRDDGSAAGQGNQQSSWSWQSRAKVSSCLQGFICKLFSTSKRK